MPEDPLDQVLRLVAEGRLTAAEAEPILAALEERGGSAGAGSSTGHAGHRAHADQHARAGDPGREIRIEVRDGTRTVVNLRLPLSIGRYALDRIPGLTGDQVARVRAALDSGMTGPVLVVDDEHASVRITIA
jgi:hypothetical protein